jgi:hypothetical protein
MEKINELHDEILETLDDLLSENRLQELSSEAQSDLIMIRKKIKSHDDKRKAICRQCGIAYPLGGYAHPSHCFWCSPTKISKE